MMEHLSINTTRKEYTQKHNKIIKTQIDALTYKQNQLKTQLLLTDIYIDRYFPIRVVNLVHDCGKEAFGDYNDNKKFLENIDKKFKQLKEKLMSEELYDRELGNKENQKKSNLVKNSYNIPSIQIPKTMSLEESSESSDLTNSSSSEQDRKSNTTYLMSDINSSKFEIGQGSKKSVFTGIGSKQSKEDVKKHPKTLAEERRQRMVNQPTELKRSFKLDQEMKFQS